VGLGPIGVAIARRITQDQLNNQRLKLFPKYDALGNLAMLAIDMALEAALDKPNQPGYYTYVSRDTLREIRKILDDAGIDWKTQHKQIRSKRT
jgi:hypothetical protein